MTRHNALAAWQYQLKNTRINNNHSPCLKKSLLSCVRVFNQKIYFIIRWKFFFIWIILIILKKLFRKLLKQLTAALISLSGSCHSTNLEIVDFSANRIRTYETTHTRTYTRWVWYIRRRQEHGSHSAYNKFGSNYHPIIYNLPLLLDLSVNLIGPHARLPFPVIYIYIWVCVLCCVVLVRV